jgi:hypothetical protein
MTFNINLPLADAIDALPVKNRSEWLNKTLPAVLDAQQANRALQAGGERAIEMIDTDLLFAEAEARSITDTMTDSRLIAILLARNGNVANGQNIRLVKDFLNDKRPRKPFLED